MHSTLLIKILHGFTYIIVTYLSAITTIESDNSTVAGRAARSPVFYGSSCISGHFSRLPFETNTGDTFSRILTSLNFVA